MEKCEEMLTEKDYLTFTPSFDTSKVFAQLGNKKQQQTLNNPIWYTVHESSYGGLVLWPGHLRQCCCYPAQRALISKFYLLYTPYITNSLSSSAGL